MDHSRLRQPLKHRVAIALAAAIALGATAWALQDLLLGTPVAPVQVTRGDIPETLSANGRITLPERVSVSTGVSGRIARVLVRQGQHVNAGDILIELEAGEAQALLDQAQVELGQAEARLRQLREPRPPAAQPGVQQNEAELLQARRQLERARDLKDKGFVSQGAVNIAQRRLDALEAAQRTVQAQARARPEISASEEAAARAAMAKARSAMLVAQTRLDESAVRAPASGTVSIVTAEAGRIVTPGRELVAIDPDGQAEIELHVSADLLPRLNGGQKAVATPEGGRLRFNAEVAWIDEHIDAERQAAEVRLAIPQPPPELRQDMKVSVQIETGKRSGVLAIPTGAVRNADSASPWVLMIIEGRAERRTVKTGIQAEGRIEIVQGLAPGDLLIPAESAVEDGARVRVVPATPPAPASPPGK